MWNKIIKTLTIAMFMTVYMTVNCFAGNVSKVPTHFLDATNIDDAYKNRLIDAVDYAVATYGMGVVTEYDVYATLRKESHYNHFGSDGCGTFWYDAESCNVIKGCSGERGAGQLMKMWGNNKPIQKMYKGWGIGLPELDLLNLEDNIIATVTVLVFGYKKRANGDKAIMHTWYNTGQVYEHPNKYGRTVRHWAIEYTEEAHMVERPYYSKE